MKIEKLAIPEIVLLTPRRFGDERGWLSVTWNRDAFAAAGVADDFVQDNQSLSTANGTVRGLHCQIAPRAQGKLVRVLRGAILDVAVDIRRGSPTYGQHVAAELSAADGRQMWIPAGFLHGFCTLESEVEVLYKVTDAYDRDAERGVVWNDPALCIAWPVGSGEAVLSEKDKDLPLLADCPAWFFL
jgi:dTDP-4-dehydrorhamnose 3,5-epimerase